MTSQPGQAPNRPAWRGLLSEGAGVTGWLEGSTLWLVCHNQGRGSAAAAATVSRGVPGELTAELDGVELIVEGELPDRFHATVIADDEAVVMLSVVGSAQPRVKVRYKGGPVHFEVRERGGPGPWPAATLNVTDPALANRLNNQWFQPIESGPGAPGHWLLDAGSLDDFVAAVAATKHAEAQRDEQHRAREEERQRQLEREQKQGSHFVNPYTFVPLPEAGPVRSAPPGHDRCDGTRPLVRISLAWHARTPLATRFRYQTPDGETGLDGSAVKGAVRSLHEALAGSCLRITDLGSAAGHRETMDAGQGRQLARVLEVAGPSGSGDRTVTLVLARRTVWVASDHLPTPLATGQPCDVSQVRGAVQLIAAFGREQLRPDPDAGTALETGPDLEWVPLLSKTGARRGKGYFVALGAFPRSPTDHDLIRISTSDPTWLRYERAAASSDDERVRRGGGTLDLEVRWDGRVVGTRQPVRYAPAGQDAIGPGHLLWVTVDAGRVIHLAAAYVWRRGAEQAVGQRVPDGSGPCHDPARLCPSCQVFGSGGEAGPDGQSGDEGHGYRGHVRLGPMVTGVAPDRPQLAPLNAPRLSAGQFYLEPSDTSQAAKGEIPLREWGSAADATGPRRLRGRKFYWPADPAEQQERRRFPNPRWRVEQVPYRQLQGRGQPAYVWPAGTVFTQTVTVVGLDRTRLGGLLAALRPDLLAGPTGEDWSRAVVRMGYGKPFGLGVLRAEATRVTAQAPADRYGPEPVAPRTVPDSELAEWVAEFVASVGAGVRAVWPDLRAVTDPDHVWPEFVTYPVDRWEDYPRDGDHRTGGDYKFRFWRQSVGNHQYPLVPLPAAHKPDQLLPLRPGEEDR